MQRSGIGKRKILQRQREGIEAAKERGAYAGKPPIKVDKAQFEQEYKLWKPVRVSASAEAHITEE